MYVISLLIILNYNYNLYLRYIGILLLLLSQAFNKKGLFSSTFWGVWPENCKDK